MTIFDTTKTFEEYAEKKLFLNSKKGLLNTIHKYYPKIWSLYKEIKSLDWSEDEFNYRQCQTDFATANKNISSIMIDTLAWQWEADSVAATCPVYMIAPFNPCVEVWETECAIMVNELVHANTYSEIVRLSFNNPDEILKEILNKQESFKRLDTISEFLENFGEFSRQYARGTKFQEDEVVRELILYYFAMLLLERVQFMASFAITFTICKSGLFGAIGSAVKKIAQDELEVHCEYRKEILKELRLAYPSVYASCLDTFADWTREVIETELTWTKQLFAGRELVGTNEEFISKWVLFNAKDVVKFAGITDLMDQKYVWPVKNPIPHLEEWFNMNMTQVANQEQDATNYKVNIMMRTDEDIQFDF